MAFQETLMSKTSFLYKLETKGDRTINYGGCFREREVQTRCYKTLCRGIPLGLGLGIQLGLGLRLRLGED